MNLPDTIRETRAELRRAQRSTDPFWGGVDTMVLTEHLKFLEAREELRELGVKLLARHPETGMWRASYRNGTTGQRERIRAPTAEGLLELARPIGEARAKAKEAKEKAKAEKQAAAEERRKAAAAKRAARAAERARRERA